MNIQLLLDVNRLVLQTVTGALVAAGRVNFS